MLDQRRDQVELEGTAIHEIAHGLLEHEVDGYAKALEFWTDRNTEIHKPDASPARFYFRDQKLVVIYLGDRGVLDQLDEDTLESELGAPADSLRSRAGKHSELRVLPGMRKRGKTVKSGPGLLGAA